MFDIDFKKQQENFSKMRRQLRNMDWSRDRFLDPFFDSVENVISNVEDVFNPEAFTESLKKLGSMPRVNVRQTTGGAEYEVVAPGFAKEDFKIELDEKQLTVSVTKVDESNTDEKDYISKEFVSSNFSRTVTLAEAVPPDSLTAKYENGILKIFVPALPKKEKAQIAIE